MAANVRIYIGFHGIMIIKNNKKSSILIPEVLREIIKNKEKDKYVTIQRHIFLPI